MSTIMGIFSLVVFIVLIVDMAQGMADSFRCLGQTTCNVTCKYSIIFSFIVKPNSEISIFLVLTWRSLNLYDLQMAGRWRNRFICNSYSHICSVLLSNLIFD